MSGSNPFRRRERESGVSPPLPKSGAITHATTISPVARAEDFTDDTAPRSKVVRIASPPVPASPTQPTSTTTNVPFPDHPGLHTSSYSRQYEDSASDSQEDRASSDPFEADQLTTDDDDPEQQSRHGAKWDPTLTDSSDDDYDSSARSSHQENPQTPGQQRYAVESPAVPRGSTAGSGGSGNKRATMDVDAFTRLLLTGDAGAERTPPMKESQIVSNKSLSRTTPGISSESSSSTDATSISRQSASEHRLSVGADTPRTSHEMSAAEADSEHKVQLSRQGSEKRQKPPPPKTRRGKLIKSDGNQQPSPQIATPYSQPDTPGSYISQPQSINTSSDTTKTVTSPTTDYFTTASRDQASLPADSLDRKPSQSKRPPTPPLARRRSQMKHVKSSASVSKPSQIVIAETSIESKHPTTPSPGVKNPPPPPSRRHGRAISGQLSEGASPSAFPFPQRTPSTSSGPPGGDESEKGVSPASSRTPSIKSSRRVSQPLGSSPSNMPPPPPPPRRARSPSRGSTDSTRPRSFHLEKENDLDAPIAEPSNANSILADLTRLQKEVDALRGQYESRKPSH